MGRKTIQQDAGSEAVEALNQVLIRGRVAADPTVREVPSGDLLWTVRVVVRRPSRRGAVGATGGSKVSVDTIDCAAWSKGAQRRVASWREGDYVEVAGAIRRRFYRAAGGVQSRVEIEVEGGRRLSRGRSA